MMERFVKWMIVSVSMLLFAMPPVEAQEDLSERKSEITMHSSSYDFGRLEFKGDKKSHCFYYTNTGDAPLIIQRATTSCNCIDVKYSRRPVAAGEQGMITVIYDPKKELGAFNKGIHLTTSAGRVTLFVKGEVLPKHKKTRKR